MLHDDVYTVFLRRPQLDGSVSLHPAGRYLIEGGEVHHLEDSYSHLAHAVPEGPLTRKSVAAIQALHVNPYVQVVSGASAGKCLDTTGAPEAEVPAPPTPKEPLPSVFDYQRIGMDRPHVVEVKGDTALMDGAALGPDETAAILENVRNQTAVVRYHKSAKPVGLSKAETETWDEIRKRYDEKYGVNHHKLALECVKCGKKMTCRCTSKHILEKGVCPDCVAQDLSKAESMPKASNTTQKAYSALDRDPSVEGMGNLYGFAKELQTERPPTEAVLVCGLNAPSSSDTADRGAVESAAARLLVGVSKQFAKGSRPYRLRSGKFAVFAKSQEDAALVARSFQAALEKLPPVGGTSPVTASVGMGADLQSAMAALRGSK